MRSWIPVPGTTTGRLTTAALELFGMHGYAPVAVGSIAKRAGVTTGSLYHHFGSKAGLYELVRTDVERRVLDRLEGAAAALPVGSLVDLAPVLLVGFDYLVRSGYARLLGEAFPEPADGGRRADEVERFLDGLFPRDEAGAARAVLLAAAWRAALWHASEGPGPAGEARAALVQLLTGR